MSTPREFDIVLVGATGFVGRLTAQYLAEQAPAGARIALAGRSQQRLEALRADLGAAVENWPLIAVDVSDPAAVADLAARTAVVATTVGPYAAYGLPLARACAAAGTHYADLTGEVLFVRESIDANEEIARRTGARIVHACGFDSIPSDLGVHILAAAVAADEAGTLGETTLYVRSLKGGFSGGTIDSMRQQTIATGADPVARKVIADSYALSPDRAAEPPSRNRGPRRGGVAGRLDSVAAALPVRREANGRWTAPFVMASFNTRIVRRTNALSGYAYGRDFRYAEMSDMGRDVGAPLRAGVVAGGLLGLVAGMSFAPTRSVLDRFLPKPGEGPDAESQRTGRFVMDIETTSTTGRAYRARVAAEKDPGYGGTAVMFGEAALSLAFDPLTCDGGVLTPAIAMGDALVERLRAQDFTLTAGPR